MSNNFFPVRYVNQCLLIYLILIVLWALRPLPLWGDIYKWIDDQGRLHFSDNLLSVPPTYRGDVQVLKEFQRLTPEGGEQIATSSRNFVLPARWVQVKRVVDGDTIVLSSGEKVRYLGIDAPETKKPKKLPDLCGQEAFLMNRRLIAGQEVALEFDVERRDRYGRLLAYVFTRDLFVNAELIRRGYAQVSTYRPNVKYREFFLRLQRQAIAEDRGLWGGCTD